MDNVIKDPEFTIGDSFEKQCSFYNNPHWFEGNVYLETSGGCLSEEDIENLHMFCQVGYESFAFINIHSGNRVMDPMTVGGVNQNYPLNTLAEVLFAIDSQFRESTLQYVGTIGNVISKGTV